MDKKDAKEFDKAADHFYEELFNLNQTLAVISELMFQYFQDKHEIEHLKPYETIGQFKSYMSSLKQAVRLYIKYNVPNQEEDHANDSN